MNHQRSFLKNDGWYSIVQYTVSFLLWMNFFCIVLFISNNTPLLLLAVIGAASFFLPRRMVFSPMTLLVLVFFFYLVACDIFLFPDSSGFGMYRKMAFAFLAGMAVFYVYRERNALFIVPLAIITALLSCGGFFFPGDALFVDGRFALFMKHPNSMAIVYSIAAVSCYAAYMNPASPDSSATDKAFVERLVCSAMRNRLLLLAVFLICMVGVWFTFSRTALYATLAVCLLLGFCGLAGRYGFTRSLLFVCLVGTVGGAALYSAPASLYQHAGVERMIAVAKAPWDDMTFRTRIPAWESAVYAFHKQPLWGNGPDSFSGTHAEYFAANRERLVQMLGPDIVEQDTKTLPHAHNQYLMFLAESGCIGLALYVSLLAYPLYVAFQRRSLFGVTIPLLLLFILLGILEAPLSGNQSAAASVTVLFMLLGYFSGTEQILGAHTTADRQRF